MISSNLQKQQFVWLRVKSESMTPREVEKQASGAADPFRVLSIGKSREKEQEGCWGHEHSCLPPMRCFLQQDSVSENPKTSSASITNWEPSVQMQESMGDFSLCQYLLPTWESSVTLRNLSSWRIRKTKCEQQPHQQQQQARSRRADRLTGHRTVTFAG